ncbi:hypothetical protein [Fusibacter tunisiensis]|uniref:Flagellar hook-length control protein FliK n=1 Tax=Fusibacter tunisiensis TaxID=1008308 RepID=A0ABS2MSD6_9FIRM|nr:hypothetical protein [Fusibacter tunisiensis]MBM7562329.1 hypothetical protein [Fusibacter tunisiensis]
MKINGWMQNLMGKSTPKELSNKQQAHQPVVTKIESKDEQAIRRLFEKYNQKPDVKSMEIINRFMETAEGTTDEKLETVEMALAKGIDLSQDNLQAIHIALTGEISRETGFLEVETPLPQMTLKEVEGLVRHLKIPEEVKQKILDTLKNETHLKKAIVQIVKALSEFVGQTGRVILDEDASMDQWMSALSKIISEIPVASNHNSTDYEQSIDQHPLKVETQTSDIKPDIKPDIAPEITSEIPEDMEVVSSDVEALVIATLDQMSVLLDNQLMDVKQFLVEQTTEATIAASKTFEVYKSEMSQVLDVPEHIKPADLTDKIMMAIEKTDRLILRSNVTLFTDMYMEKELMHASARLGDAKNFVLQGDVAKAVQLVKEVQKQLDEMVFKPSLKRVEAFVTQNGKAIQPLFERPLSDKNPLPNRIRIDAQAQAVLTASKDASGVRHARDIMEILRFTGVNHEAEIAEKVEQKDFQKHMEWQQNNVKEILLKLMKEETDQRTVQKSLMNLTGQQMMNQQNQDQGRQTHYFNMPYEDGESVGSMKVYVSGRKNGMRLDADNTELYFGMDSRKLGGLGIRVTIQAGKVSVKVMTDAPEKIKPAFDGVFETLDEIGYDKGTLEWSDFSTKTQEKQPKETFEYQPEKGFDFKI